jgi:SAM-dependent methyltransferase
MNMKLVLSVILLGVIPQIPGESKHKSHHHAISPVDAARQALVQKQQHLELLNYLIQARGYKSYLEIGVADGNNFRGIAIERKVGVDPGSSGPNIYQMTSDDFFQTNRETFDIVFIDGLHWWDQVLRDVENALNCLNPGGVIVMHDCMPQTEEQQFREIPAGAWNGDVWKAAAYIRMHADNVHFCVIDMDWGCGILTPNSTQQLYTPARPIEMMDWDFYQKNKKELLNVKSLGEWLKETR